MKVGRSSGMVFNVRVVPKLSRNLFKVYFAVDITKGDKEKDTIVRITR